MSDDYFSMNLTKLHNYVLRKDIIDSPATNEKPICDILVYFNLLQTKQDWLLATIMYKITNILQFYSDLLVYASHWMDGFTWGPKPYKMVAKKFGS